MASVSQWTKPFQAEHPTASHSIGCWLSPRRVHQELVCRVAPALVPAESQMGSGVQLVGRARKYGGKFQGFGEYLREEAGSLADVSIVAPDGTTHRAHKLLLAYHSEFFRRAFAADFKEKEEQRVVLGFEDPAGVWRMMLDFFYTDEVVLTDETVLPLLAMSRELMVKSIEDYCSDYAQNSLEASNAIQYLNQAVQFNCDSFRESCVALVAEGFPSSFNKPTDGLPSEVMLEVLNHPNLVVQTEEQVLTFVLNYVPRHELPADIIRKLYEQVRFTFLSNERLANLAQEDTVPKDLLLAAMASRFSLIDHPERLAALMAISQGTGAGPTPVSPSLPPRPRRQSSNTGSTSGAAAREATSSSAADVATANALAAAGIPVSSCSHTSMPNSPLPSSFQQANGSNSSNHPPRGSNSGSGNNSALLTSLTLTLPPQLAPTYPYGANMFGLSAAASNPHCMLPRKTYICSIEYGLPGGSEYASVPLHEVWEDLVPQMHVRVSGDVVEGDAQSILRVHDQDSSWFMVSGEAGAQQPVWIEIELPSNMRVVELTKYTFSHGMNFANHMFPYGISDSAWFQMKGLFTQVSEGDSDHFYPLRTSESSNSSMQFEYTVAVDSAVAGQRIPPWRRLRISTNEEQSNGNVRLSVRKLRLYGRVEISLTREGPPGGRDVLACWRRRKEAAAARQQVASRKSLAHNLGHNI